MTPKPSYSSPTLFTFFGHPVPCDLSPGLLKLKLFLIFADAVISLQRCVKIHPSYAEYWIRLSEMYVQLATSSPDNSVITSEESAPLTEVKCDNVDHSLYSEEFLSSLFYVSSNEMNDFSKNNGECSRANNKQNKTDNLPDDKRNIESRDENLRETSKLSRMYIDSVIKELECYLVENCTNAEDKLTYGEKASNGSGSNVKPCSPSLDKDPNPSNISEQEIYGHTVLLDKDLALLDTQEKQPSKTSFRNTDETIFRLRQKYLQRFFQAQHEFKFSKEYITIQPDRNSRSEHKRLLHTNLWEIRWSFLGFCCFQKAR